MKPTLSPWKWLAILAIVGTGLIHVLEAQDSFGDAMYKGLLFVGNGVAGVVAAIGIARGRRWLGWRLGLFVAAGSMMAYVASRTIGLPGLAAEPDAWLEPMGVASLACEALFIACAVATRSAWMGAGGVAREAA